jgi:hypothetical protein
MPEGTCTEIRHLRALTLVLAAGAGLALTAMTSGSALAAGDKRAAPPQARLLPAAAAGPVTIVVSTDAQRLTVYDGDSAVAETTVSTGLPEHPTPHGVFSVIEKQVFHRSNLYSDAPMPFMQRLTWSGVALHEGHVTGRPASHGCVRLPQAFAKELFRYTKRGARVIISRQDVTPEPLIGFASFASPSPKRFVMGEAADDGRFAGEIEPPDASISISRAKPGREIVAAAPITALVNRKTGKMYVRRAFMPVFEIPVTIDEPNRPLGAHLYVAQAGARQATASGGASEMAWTAVSVPGRMREALLDAPGPRRAAQDVGPASIVFEPSAREALRRIHLAPGPAARLSALLAPGAALILSDDGARGRESWAGTNFIALVE